MNKEVNIEINKCVLCHDAPCKKIYKNINPERIIRAIKFDNIKGARTFFDENSLEKNENSYKCPMNVDIAKILNELNNIDKIDDLDIDLSTSICKVKLENPFLLSSSVVGSSYDMCKRALEYGFAGVVVKTISMMDIHESSPRFSAIKDSDGFVGFKNIEQLSQDSVEENMEMIKKIKEEFPKKVIIASIMGRNEEEWAYLAKEATKAGADLLELNFSCPNMKYKKTGSDVGQNPELVKKYTKVVKNNTNIPVLAKMTPNITYISVPAIASKEGGADGISAINTIKSITGVNIDKCIPEPLVNDKSSLGGYSGRAVKPLALRYIAEMTKNPLLNGMDFSGIGGIYTWKDALEFMLLGCSSVQMTTSIMEYGYRIVDDLILGLKIYMKEHGYNKVSDFIGLAKNNLVSNDLLEKDTIEYPKFIREKCIGCGRCYISCRDGGHSAIKFEDRTPILDPHTCVGCGLCRLVCPFNAIEKSSNRVNKTDLKK